MADEEFYSMSDSAIEAVLDNCLVDEYENDARMVVYTLGDSMGYGVNILSADGSVSFGKASAATFNLAVSLACARATAFLQQFKEEEASETAALKAALADLAEDEDDE